MVTLRNIETWDLVLLSDGWKPIKCKWVLKNKINLYDIVEKNKASLVVKRYSQVEGIYFGEIFSLVFMLTSIRFLLSIETTFDLEKEHMDTKTTFLHGDLNEEIYMT
jgi:hypothetical protein